MLDDVSRVRKYARVPFIILTSIMSSMAFQALAQEKALQDMSDPLAVYTQAGGGVSDKGLNVKLGQTYDSGKPNTMAMNIFEAKGIGGRLLNIRGDNNFLYKNVDDSIDSFRLRNFQVNIKNGLGKQFDINYDVDNDKLDASYSLIQALPKWGVVQLYPLVGAGVTIADDEQEGYEIPGTFTVIGMYSKISVTDKIWINYNPMYMHTLSGSENYKSKYYVGANNILTHEFALSYQLAPRTNIRYFANWNENINFGDGDHRIELNYQF